MWYLIALIWIAMIAGIVWAYRRKSKKRIAERERQYEALLTELKVKPCLSAGDVDPTTDGPSEPVPVPVPSIPARRFSRKQRLLPRSAALLYYVFKTGLPDHEVFAGLTLSELVEIESALPGYDRAQTACKLTHCRLDLVVCTKQFEVIAAVLVDGGATADAAWAENARFAEECLGTAGVRLLRIDAAAPPRREQVRELVYGGA